MSQAANSLRLQYGLGLTPTDYKIDEWLKLVKRYIGEGNSKDSAGEMAAKQIFPDYQTHFFASEADTIETLLRLAENK